MCHLWLALYDLDMHVVRTTHQYHGIIPKAYLEGAESAMSDMHVAASSL